MLTDFYVPEPSKHWLSAELSVAVLVVVALAVLAGLVAVLFKRIGREDSAAMSAWTERATAEPQPLSAEDTREIAVPREPGQVRSHRARNERAMRERVSNASDQFAATVTRVKERKS